MIKKISILLLCLSAALNLKAQRIDLHEQDGGFSIDASVNGVGIKTFYTEESWFVSMSSNTYLFLYENGYISDSDVKGLTTLKMPDGSSTKAASFLIRRLRVGRGLIIKDIPAFVIKKQTVPMLIGSSVFESLGEVTREGSTLTIGGEEAPLPAEEPDKLDLLKEEAQAAIDSSDFARAAACFEQLKAEDGLNMVTEYQYAMVLSALERDAENVEVSTAWTSEHEGRSLMMDYWINNNLGGSHARLKQNQKAIECYEKAIDCFYRLYNTSEKSIRKGDFHDETLGATFYSLGVVHASEGKVSRMESCFALAAKCGNQKAAEFCRQYKIRY